MRKRNFKKLVAGLMVATSLMTTGCGYKIELVPNDSTVIENNVEQNNMSNPENNSGNNSSNASNTDVTNNVKRDILYSADDWANSAEVDDETYEELLSHTEYWFSDVEEPTVEMKLLYSDNQNAYSVYSLNENSYNLFHKRTLHEVAPLNNLDSVKSDSYEAYYDADANQYYELKNGKWKETTGSISGKSPCDLTGLKERWFSDLQIRQIGNTRFDNFQTGFVYARLNFVTDTRRHDFA